MEQNDENVAEKHDDLKPVTPAISRRNVLKYGALGLVGAGMLSTLKEMVTAPNRIAHAAPASLPDIQFDIANYIAPAQTIDNVLFRFGPVYTVFAGAQLTRNPTKHDQQALDNALQRIEGAYPFSPGGLFITVSYGLPYFNRLPSALFQQHVPRLLSDQTRFALEEIKPGPTDVSPLNPGITKPNFNVPVKIEANDVLFTLRSDSLVNLYDIMAWFKGSNRLNHHHVQSPHVSDLFHFTTERLIFAQRGLPRLVAESTRQPYADRIHPQGPMWMSFSDQQVDGSGPAQIVTFQGNASAQFTTCKAGDYFYNGAVQPFSHIILDLAPFYDLPYDERVQLMFRSTPAPAKGNADQYTNSGGPAFLDNKFLGAGDAAQNAQLGRMGHLAAIQRVSRAADGTPLHMRIDGPGFDALDVPDGSSQPKLQFSAFLPAAAVAALVRRNQASLDLAQQFNIPASQNGIEIFSTATRRQMFLVPPRSHRSFPLLELS